ncbi:MAG: isochorismatase family protein [Geminicoccaceae bacterium]
MNDTAVYKKQEMGRPISLGARPALLVVDFVNGFLDPEMFGGGNVVEAAQNTKPVMEQFRACGSPIAYTRIVYAEDGSDCGVWCEKAPRLKELTNSSAHSHIADFLSPEPGDIVIQKTQASAFFGTALSSILRSHFVDTLFVTGATTSGCVRASVVDALSLNFRPVVLADCVGDRAMGPHQANLFDMEQKYANVISSNEALKTLQASK